MPTYTEILYLSYFEASWRKLNDGPDGLWIFRAVASAGDCFFIL